jgi:hypothetical protein
MISLDPVPIRDTSPTDNAASGQPESSPLTDEEKLRYDRVVIRDELSEAQCSPTDLLPGLFPRRGRATRRALPHRTPHRVS